MGEPTYELVASGRAIRCLMCGRTSHHPDDVRFRYCGACHVSHELLAWLRRAETVRQGVSA